jgi:hypothetical protein
MLAPSHRAASVAPVPGDSTTSPVGQTLRLIRNFHPVSVTRALWECALGQVLTPESGPMFYEYDVGDGWIHRLELTGSLPAPADAPRARFVDGVTAGGPPAIGGQLRRKPC